MLNREQLLARKIRREEVSLGDGSVFVRGMTGTERDLWEQQQNYHRNKAGEKGWPYLRASLAVYTVCDDNGQLVFKPEDLKAVSAMPAADLSTIWDAALRLSAVTKEDADKLGEGLTANADSTSDSPAT